MSGKGDGGVLQLEAAMGRLGSALSRISTSKTLVGFFCNVCPAETIADIDDEHYIFIILALAGNGAACMLARVSRRWRNLVKDTMARQLCLRIGLLQNYSDEVDYPANNPMWFKALSNCNGLSIREVDILAEHTKPVCAVAVDTDGHIYSAGEDRRLRIWCMCDLGPRTMYATRTIDNVASRSQEASAICSVAIHPDDGRIVSGTDDGTLTILSTRWEVIRETDGQEGHELAVSALAIRRSDGCIVSGDQDSVLKIWSADGVFQTDLTGHEACVNAVAILQDGRIVSGSDDYTLRIWSADGVFQTELAGHEGCVNAVAILPDGRRIVSGSTDKTLKIWLAQSGEWRAMMTLEGHTASVLAVAIHPDGRIISASDDHTLKIWSTQTGECLATLSGHTGIVTAVAILPDGCVVSGSDDTTLRIWA